MKLIIFDMDGTIVQYKESRFHGSWDALGYALGLKTEWDNLIDYFYRKKSRHEEWARKNALLLKGKKLLEASCIFQIPYSPGIKEFCCATKNLTKGIITGGINIIADKVKEELLLDFAFSNIIHVVDGTFTGELTYIVDIWKKEKIVKEVAEKYETNLKNICYIGDNESDISCFDIVGLPVAFNPKTEKTASAAKYVIYNFENLEEILKNEGIF